MKKLALIVPMATLAVGQAVAAVPQDVTDTLNNVKADIITVGTAIVVLAAVVMGFRWLKAQFF